MMPDLTWELEASKRSVSPRSEYSTDFIRQEALYMYSNVIANIASQMHWPPLRPVSVLGPSQPTPKVPLRLNFLNNDPCE